MRGVYGHFRLKLKARLSLAATAKQITTGLDLLRRNLCDEKMDHGRCGRPRYLAERQKVVGRLHGRKIRADTEGDSV
jgi:hypothetical protein